MCSSLDCKRLTVLRDASFEPSKFAYTLRAGSNLTAGILSERVTLAISSQRVTRWYDTYRHNESKTVKATVFFLTPLVFL